MIEGAGVRSVQLHPRARAASPLGYTTNAEQNRTRSAEEACERYRWTLGELYHSYKDNHAPRRDTQHPSTNKQMHTRGRRPITSRPSHRRIRARGAYTHKATSTRITISYRRISTRVAHRLTVQDNSTYARPAGSHQVIAESVHAAHIHTRRPVHASRPVTAESVHVEHIE